MKEICFDHISNEASYTSVVYSRPPIKKCTTFPPNPTDMWLINETPVLKAEIARIDAARQIKQ